MHSGLFNTSILGLGRLYKKEEVYANWLRKLMAMPLLPQSEIPNTFSVLEAQVFVRESDMGLVNKFKKSVKKTWILGEKDLSVYSALLDEKVKTLLQFIHKTPLRWKIYLAMRKRPQNDCLICCQTKEGTFALVPC